MVENLPATPPAQCVDPRHRPDSGLDTVHDKAVFSMVENFGNRTVSERDQRGSAGHRLDQDQSERLGPVDGKEQCEGIAEKFVLLLLSNLADVFNQGVVKKGFDVFPEIFPIGRIDFGGDAQGDPRAFGDFDGAIDPFFR